MQIIKTDLPGVLLIQPSVHKDQRGYLYESFKAETYAHAGIGHDFVQENVSLSHKNVLRGLHLQKKRPQGKLIQVLHGSIYDVAVDIRPDSRFFGKYTGQKINADNHCQLWIPPGFAHGFCVLSETATIHYKCTDYYDASDETGIAWNCPKINISWPIKQPILSAKDQNHPGLAEYIKKTGVI